MMRHIEGGVIESILIAAFPTANSAKPKIDRETPPKEAVEVWRQKRDLQLDHPELWMLLKRLKKRKSRPLSSSHDRGSMR